MNNPNTPMIHMQNSYACYNDFKLTINVINLPYCNIYNDLKLERT